MFKRQLTLILSFGLLLSGGNAFAKDCEGQLMSAINAIENERIEAAKAWKLLEDFWTTELKKFGRQLPMAKLVLFDGEIQTACGEQDDGFGPFYCLLDHTVYMPVLFWKILNQAMDRESAAVRLMVLAHEYGHHVMTQIGFQWKVHALVAYNDNPDESHKLMELGENMADALAGYFAAHLSRKNRLTAEDHADLLNLFEGIGDDRMHEFFKIEKVEGCLSHHGCSQDRLGAFQAGLEAESLDGLFQNRYEWLLSHTAVTAHAKRKVHRLLFRPKIFGWPIGRSGI